MPAPGTRGFPLGHPRPTGLALSELPAGGSRALLPAAPACHLPQPRLLGAQGSPALSWRGQPGRLGTVRLGCHLGCDDLESGRLEQWLSGAGNETGSQSWRQTTRRCRALHWVTVAPSHLWLGREGWAWRGGTEGWGAASGQAVVSAPLPPHRSRAVAPSGEAVIPCRGPLAVAGAFQG